MLSGKTQTLTLSSISHSNYSLSPHILYQIGSLVHVFPVMGSDLGIKPEDISKMTLEDISNDIIGNNCSLSLQFTVTIIIIYSYKGNGYF